MDKRRTNGSVSTCKSHRALWDPEQSPNQLQRAQGTSLCVPSLSLHCQKGWQELSHPLLTFMSPVQGTGLSLWWPEGLSKQFAPMEVHPHWLGSVKRSRNWG